MSGSESGWQDGDLALCILGGKVSPYYSKPLDYPVCGRLYTVGGVDPAYTFLGPVVKVALILVDGPPNKYKDHTWAAHRFVKIPPHKMDIDDEEVLSQMLNKPVPIRETVKPKESVSP